MNTKSLDDLEALDYPVRIEYDREESVYVADFLDLPGCSAAGSTVSEAYDRAQKAKAEWLRVAVEQGLPIPKPSKTAQYSGRILVRVPTSLHAMLADRARTNGTSLNQYIVHLLSAGAIGDDASSKLQALEDQVRRIWQVAAEFSYGHFRGPEAERSTMRAWQTSPRQTASATTLRIAHSAAESARLQ